MTPAMLIETLTALRGRVRRLTALYGVGVLLACVGLALLSIGVLDWTFHLSGMWRALLLAGGIALIIAAIVRNLAAPLRSSLPLTDVAGRIEKVFPQFDDRLRSAVGFIHQPTQDSPEMQRATIEQAVNLATTLRLSDVIDPRPALRSLAIGAGLVIAVSATVATLSPATRSILVARVFNPFTSVKWPRTVQIAMLKPIANRVPVGGRVEVEMKLERGDSARVRPIVYYETDGGSQRQEYLTRGDDGRYTASLDARTDAAAKGGSMKVWIVAGDDETKPSAVEVVPRLSVESFAANVAPPAYATTLQPAAFDLLGQQASGLIGSGVDLTLKFTKRIANASDVRLIALDDVAAPAVVWNAVDDHTVHGVLRLDRTMRFRVDANDIDGFPTETATEFELVAKPDQMPIATIENPRRSEERTPESVVPLVGLLEDDVAVRDASLNVTRVAGGSNQSWTVPLMKDGGPVASVEGERSWSRLDDASGRSRARVQYAWALSSLADAKLKPGDVLEYGLSVTDNYELDGQRHPPAESGKLRITIISQDELSNRVADELRQVRAQVEQVKQKHDQTTGETESFKTDVKGKPTLDAADTSVSTRLQQQQSSVASASKAAADRLNDVAKTMDENKSPSTDLQQMAKDVGEHLNQTVEGSMKDAMSQLASASQKESKDEPRQASLERTNASQKQASAELAEALKRLDEVGSLNATIDQLQKMLDAQRDLSAKTAELAAKNTGKTPEQMNAGDRQKASDLAAQQAKLSEQTAKTLDRLGKTADQLAKSDPMSSEAMMAAQKQGSRQNVAPSQKQASQQISQNKSAKQSQQQAEAGLESMLNELRDAQNRKLAELQKKLAELQAQIEILVRRQSGHNLDNLTLQGPDVVSANAPLIAELTTKGGRKPTDAKPELGRLLAAQGQSERNARDIATSAAAVPDGAEPASKLTRAATLMERAAVNLRDKKLVEAYEPPQLDALATLQEAKRMVDEQKQKADDAADKQQREAIRAAYVRIRGDEEKLADETKRLDGARTPQGDLNRADGVRLGQLPTEQQKLADDIEKVGQNLVKLKSTVYIWANKQISAGMADVKVSLTAAKTDADTQSHQTQVLDDLQAMIDNLKVDPLERKFESEGGGGGGGGGGGDKPLPPEAELRLMRALQQRVNVGTKSTGEAKLADDAKATALVTLGRRQADIRKLLGDMMNKAAGKGENAEPEIAPEGADAKPLPEETQLAQIDDQELQAELLGGKPGEDSKQVDVRRAADRMVRSHQRLETQRDPGKVTQVIQRRIVDDLDLLVEAARKQQCNGKDGGGKPSPQDVAQVPKPSQSQSQSQGKNSAGGSKSAANSNSPGGNTGQANAGKNILETAEEWGRISPRLRGPVLESRDETIVERYRRLIEDYTQAVSTEAGGGSSGGTAATPTTQPTSEGGTP